MNSFGRRTCNNVIGITGLKVGKLTRNRVGEITGNMLGRIAEIRVSGKAVTGLE